MDYILADAMRDTGIALLCVTYDIACKFLVHLRARLEKDYPTKLVEHLLKMVIRGFVPKFHLPAHGPACQTKWSLNWASAVGRTDGEAIERDWADHNWLGTQSFEMGPGARHQVIEDSMSHANFRRLCSLRTC
jgi:hypothetical protein